MFSSLLVELLLVELLLLSLTLMLLFLFPPVLFVHPHRKSAPAGKVVTQKRNSREWSSCRLPFYYFHTDSVVVVVVVVFVNVARLKRGERRN